MSKESPNPFPGNSPIDVPSHESAESEEKVFTFIYRGDNPYLDSLAAQLQVLGHTVHTHKIPVDTAASEFKDKVATLGQFEGKIITDGTLNAVVREVSGEAALNGYSLLRWKIENVSSVVEKLRPIINEITDKGRTPVALHKWLGDHLPSSGAASLAFELKDSAILQELNRMDAMGEGREARNNSNAYATALKEGLNLAVITKKDFVFGHENIPQILERMGIESQEAVVLVDHHVYEMSKRQRELNGFNSLEIVPICPCCIGNVALYTDQLQRAGFNLYPLSYEGEISANIEKLTEA